MHGSRGQSIQIDTVVDTGFDGWLTLPAEIIRTLELEYRNQSRAILADGREIQFGVYHAFLEWDGAKRRIVVDEA